MTRPQEDTLVRHARREAAAALSMWLVAMIYSITYCYTYGYGRSADSLSFVLWFPDWVFWGIIAPWSICAVGSIFFAFWFMGDEGLGEEIDADPDGMMDSRTAEPGGEVHDG